MVRQEAGPRRAHCEVDDARPMLSAEVVASGDAEVLKDREPARRVLCDERRMLADQIAVELAEIQISLIGSVRLCCLREDRAEHHLIERLQRLDLEDLQLSVRHASDCEHHGMYRRRFTPSLRAKSRPASLDGKGRSSSIRKLVSTKTCFLAPVAVGQATSRM